MMKSKLQQMIESKMEVKTQSKPQSLHFQPKVEITRPMDRSIKTTAEQTAVKIEKVDFYYGSNLALQKVFMEIPQRQVTALIGPSGCGKSTLLRCVNRLNDLIDETRMEGSIEVYGRDIKDPAWSLSELRKDIGMVFQKSNPFPKTIYENIAYGPQIHGVSKKSELDAIVEQTLKNVGLWKEVKDRLDASALQLSGGQQQRLCIARAIAVEPKVLLMDEPCSALDPIATAKIEELIVTLKEQYTILIVTHNMQQAARVADFTGFMLMGELVEFGFTDKIFTNPNEKRTEDYITGRFG